MDALSSISQRTPEAASPRAASVTSGQGGFAQAFVALFSGADDTQAAKLAPKQRQDDADDGKTLPDENDDAAAATVDPRLLWLPGSLPATETLAQAIVAPTQPNPPLATPVALVAQTATTPPIIAPPPDVQIRLAPPGSSDLGVEKSGQAHRADIFDAAGRLAAEHAGKPDAKLQVQPAPGTIVPIATPTAAPLPAEFTAMLKDAEKTTVDDWKSAGEPVVPVATMTTEIALQNAVQPSADTRHVPLDLRDDQGLQRMIDRIEALRDDADSRDTRIRLVPDALGAVDVAVRPSGDSLHVHFTAENAATRALLADAQPRLLELADARGVRIAGVSVDAGTSGGGGQQTRPHSRQPDAPASAAFLSITTDVSGGDVRLA